MKKLILPFIILASAVSLHAQEIRKAPQKTSYSIGIDVATPIGLLSTNLFSVVIGGSLQAEFPVSKSLSLTATSGYELWKAQKNLVTLSFIPILGGAKYYFSPKVYSSGQLGVSIGTDKNGGNPFTYVPGIGFLLGKNIDLLLKSTGLTLKGGVYINNLGVRIAYHFR